IAVRAAGDRLQVQPAAAVPPELYAKLREHKRAVWHWLRILFRVRDALGGVRPTLRSTAAESACNMSLEHFRLAGVVVEVRSDVLGETVVFASDNAHVDRAESRPVYRAQELFELWAVVDVGDLRRVHQQKRALVTTEPRASHPGGFRAGGGP